MTIIHSMAIEMFSGSLSTETVDESTIHEYRWNVQNGIEFERIHKQYERQFYLVQMWHAQIKALILPLNFRLICFWVCTFIDFPSPANLRNEVIHECETNTKNERRDSMWIMSLFHLFGSRKFLLVAHKTPYLMYKINRMTKTNDLTSIFVSHVAWNNQTYWLFC